MRYQNAEIKISDRINPTFLFKGGVGQDGAVFKDLLFRFEANGVCTVYSLSKKEEISKFTLDKVDMFKPHSNAVFFGTERFSPDDEYPLLYTNLYNNYSEKYTDGKDRREGMCCVYRLTRNSDRFETKLVQIIKIGFVEDLDLWMSLPDRGDIRPYGNFVIDVDKNRLYAFVMRDKNKTARYFEFRIPKCSDGTFCAKCGANFVTLEPSDILSYFDTPYSRILQGACAYNGKIFSIEGGTVRDANPKNPPKMRIIDTEKKCETAVIDLAPAGLTVEPELIDFEGDTCYFMDGSGALYTIEFI